MSTPEATTARHRLAVALDPNMWPHRGLSPLNRALAGLIVVSILLGIIETEPAVTRGAEWLFSGVEAALLCLFVAEYAARLWVAPENRHYGGRLRWALRPASVVDFAVIVGMAMPFLGAEASLLRMLRLVRLARLARHGRLAAAFRHLRHAVSSRGPELAISVLAAFGLMLASSACLYLVEGRYQPDAFGSIPRAMWWAVATMTTVGYGDVVPVTGLGRVFAAVTALTGVALIAVPTGILAGAFADAFEASRAEREEGRERRKERRFKD